MWKRTGRPFEKVGEIFLNVRKALPYYFPVLGDLFFARIWEKIG